MSWKVLSSLLQCRSRGLSISGLSLVLVTWAGQATAHEFWLQPSSYIPTVGGNVSITLRNGQKFKGNSLPYVNEWFQQFFIAGPTGRRKASGVPGDDPASVMAVAAAGLSVVAYVSTPDEFHFKTRKKLDDYFKKEGIARLALQLKDWQFPHGGITESYIRCAKALIDVGGSGKGRDKALGLPFEIIAQVNPYRLPTGASLPIRVLYRGRPMPDALVNIFIKGSAAPPRGVRTDARGRAMVPLPTKGVYLLNAVHMLDPPKDASKNWQSYWASMTFQRP